LLDTINPNVINIAKEYFKDILYVDDAIKKPDDLKTMINSLNQEIAVASEPVQTVNDQPAVRRPVMHTLGADERNEPVQQLELEQKLLLNKSLLDDYYDAFEIIYNLNNNGNKVSPFFFEGDHQVDRVTSLIEHSHLTILDWELDLTGGETTIKILDSVLKNTKRLKLLVVYTKNPLQASKMIRDKFEDKIIDSGQTNVEGSMVDIFDFQEAFILVCKKKELPSNKLLETFIDLLVRKFGLFQFVFFDAINKIVSETATILKQFSYPFENTLLLQLQSSGFNSTDYAKIISRMVANHITKVIDVDSRIMDEITERWKKNIVTLLAMEDTKLLELLSSKFETLEQAQNSGTNGKKNKKYISYINKISLEKWREIFTLMQGLNLNEAGSLKPVMDIIIEHVVAMSAEADFEKNKKLVDLCQDNQTLKEQCLALYRSNVKSDVTRWVSPLLPSILLTLIADHMTPNYSSSVADLVHLMKVIEHKDIRLDNINTIIGTNAIVNYLNTGDILIDGDKHLLCISPSCDVFRPEKVKNKLKFVTGKKIDGDSAFINLKTYEHLTILPDYENPGKLICVLWDFSLTEVHYIGDLSNYIRPYRLESGYIQQIMNAYIAYQSRTGVDELFVKNSSSLRNFYVFN
jgi:hypothetical protein